MSQNLKKLTIQQICDLEKEAYNMKEEVIKFSKMNLQPYQYFDQFSQKYQFLFNHSKKLFNIILRDFSQTNDDFKTERQKFKRDIDFLFSSLKKLNEQQEVSYYEASKNYEKQMRQFYFPKNILDEIEKQEKQEQEKKE